MGLVKEFKEFVSKGNVMDLAIGVIIGGAFGKIVYSLVGDVIMPLVNPLIPGGDWKLLEIGPGVRIGSFLGTILDFIVIAFVIFMVIKAMAASQKKKAEAPAASPVPSAEHVLLGEIRDLLAKK